MKKKIINLENHELRDLDRIVSDVLDAIEHQVRSHLGLTAEEWEFEGEGEDAPPSRPEEERPDRSQTQTAVAVAQPRADVRRGQSASMVIEMDKNRRAGRSRKTVARQWTHVSPELETALDAPDEVLFDKDEEAFIRQCIAFLRPRDNKDMLISRIWNLITEAEPDAFYSPREDHDGEGEIPPPDDGNDGAAGEPPDGETPSPPRASAPEGANNDLPGKEDE